MRELDTGVSVMSFNNVGVICMLNAYFRKAVN